MNAEECRKLGEQLGFSLIVVSSDEGTNYYAISSSTHEERPATDEEWKMWSALLSSEKARLAVLTELERKIRKEMKGPEDDDWYDGGKAMAKTILSLIRDMKEASR